MNMIFLLPNLICRKDIVTTSKVFTKGSINLKINAGLKILLFSAFGMLLRRKRCHHWINLKLKEVSIADT